MIRPLLLAALLLGTAATAEPPLRPTARPMLEPPGRPEMRPAPVVAEARTEPAMDLWRSAPAETLQRAAHRVVAKAPDLPPSRPDMPWMDVTKDLAPAEADGEAEATPLAVAFALRPPERPPAITETAQRVKAERARGQICSTPELQGDVVGTVPGPGECGIDHAVRVRSVAGVVLSTPATMDCTTARSLLAWVQTGAIPAVGSRGGGLHGLRIVGHYACRGRNNVQGARLSEHSFGRAVDIAAFHLRDGSEISVLRDWGRSHGDTLRRMWRAACGPFGTVLGPNADAAHRDHFHFDTARYRSGSYCR